MKDDHAQLGALIREIRTAFNLLKSLAEQLHADLDITPSMRAVLEAFIQQSPRTVPEIAREKGVSRQHIQTVANVLLDAGLLESKDNPGHKKSPLYQPTPEGKQLFAEVRTREAAPLLELAAALSEAGVAKTGITDATMLLATMNQVVQSITEKGN